MKDSAKAASALAKPQPSSDGWIPSLELGTEYQGCSRHVVGCQAPNTDSRRAGGHSGEL